jgi:Protein of unknown function (DUF2397)
MSGAASPARRGTDRRTGNSCAGRQNARQPRPLQLGDASALRGRRCCPRSTCWTPGAFRLFLALLGDALAARMPHDTEVKTVTSDGTLEVRLSLVPDGGTATIRTADGLLTGPQHVVEITDLTAS